jgi:hypothetical protein
MASLVVRAYGFFSTDELTYTFRDANFAPTPEPTVVWLLMIGLAGVFTHRARAGHALGPSA